MMKRRGRIISIVAIILIVLACVGGLVYVNEQKVPSNEAITYSLIVGNHFQIGPFATTVGETSSGDSETDCDKFKPTLIGTLKNMQAHMQSTADAKGLGTAWSASFSVDEKTLDLLCNKQITMNLRDQQGDLLILQKVPFKRTTSPDGSGAQGTLITIYAAIVLKGAPTPSQPDDYGRLFIADNLLSATSTQSQH